MTIRPTSARLKSTASPLFNASDIGVFQIPFNAFRSYQFQSLKKSIEFQGFFI